MRKVFRILMAAGIFGASGWGLYGSVPRVAAEAPDAAGSLTAPKPPEHRKRNITTAADLAADFQDIVEYLEKGQVYYREYQTGTHSVAENADFLNFLEAYEKELKLAKREIGMLQSWVKQRSALDTPAP